MHRNIKKMGHDFTRNREGEIINPWANGVKPVSKGKTRKTVNYPFFLLCPVIYKLVGEVNAWGWEEYGSQIQIWEATHFRKMCFWLHGQVNASKCMPKPLFTHIFHSSHAARRWLSSLLHDLCHFLHFSIPRTHFLCCWENGKKGTMFWGLKSLFFPMRKLGDSLTFFFHFP